MQAQPGSAQQGLRRGPRTAQMHAPQHGGLQTGPMHGPHRDLMRDQQHGQQRGPTTGQQQGQRRGPMTVQPRGPRAVRPGRKTTAPPAPMEPAREQAVPSPPNPHGKGLSTRIDQPTIVRPHRAAKTLLPMRISAPSNRRIFTLRRFTSRIARPLAGPLPAGPVRPGRTLTGSGPAVPVPAVPVPVVPVLIGQLQEHAPARPGPSRARAVWRGPSPPAAAFPAQAARVPAVNPAGPTVPEHGPAPVLARVMAPSGLMETSPAAVVLSAARPSPTRRAPRAHPTIARPRRSRIPAPALARREKPVPTGSQNPASVARANPATAARTGQPPAPSPGPAASPSPATRASQAAPEASARASGPAENPAENAANSL